MKARYHAATGGNGQTRPPDNDPQRQPAPPPDDAPMDDSGTFAPAVPKQK